MMKLKKVLTGRPFIISALTVLCVGAIAIFFYVNYNKKPAFIPDPTPAGQLTDNWEENMSDVKSGTSIGTAASGEEAVPNSDENQYPKEIKNGDNNVIVDFTDPEHDKPKAPEKPETSSDTKKPDKQPEYKDEELKPQASTSVPAPGSKNEKGEVYDPVFGWIKPGDAEAEPIHNDGDPNKQIGSME